MKKVLLLLMIIIGVCVLEACSNKDNEEIKTKYKVDYCGSKSLFKGAKDSYEEGDTVKLTFSMIATDTDYTFYVDGEAVNPDWKNEAYVIKFKMPAHDVTVDYKAVNSMIYNPGNEMNPSSFLRVEYDENLQTVADGTVGMYVKDYDEFEEELTLVLVNNTEADFYYGPQFSLKHSEDGELRDVELSEEICWADIVYTLAAHETIEIECDMQYYGKLMPGEYCVYKSLGDLYAYFTIIEEWTE